VSKQSAVTEASPCGTFAAAAAGTGRRPIATLHRELHRQLSQHAVWAGGGSPMDGP